jgi:uncharacterized protein (DUF305 family)
MDHKVFAYLLTGLLSSGVVVGGAIANPAPTLSSLLAQQPMRMGRIDQHFIEMMIPHHQDAVKMAELALVRASHPELKQLAAAIKRDQTREIQQMRTWYQQWYGRPVPTTPTMGGGRMGGGRMGGPGRGACCGAYGRRGMMEIDLEALKTVPDFDREFILQMIPHHQMAVMMAQMLQSGTSRPEMEKLASDIIRTQTAEINQMEQWYQAWYPR